MISLKKNEEKSDNLPDTEFLLNSFAHLIPEETKNLLGLSQKEEKKQTEHKIIPNTSSNIEIEKDDQKKSSEDEILTDSNIFKGVLDPNEKVEVFDYDTNYEINAQYLPQKIQNHSYCVSVSVDADSYGISKTVPYVSLSSSSNSNSNKNNDGHTKTTKSEISYVQCISDEDSYLKTSKVSVGSGYSVSSNDQGYSSVKVDEKNNFNTTSMASHPYCFAF